MVIVLEEHVSEKDVERIIKALNDFGFDVHRSTGVNQTVLGAVVGVKRDFDECQLEVMPGVARVYRINEPFKLASRSFKPEKSVFDINGIKIGGNDVVVMAGPCSVESEKQIFTIAEQVAKQGARFLRGGGYKPRTSPYSFQGLGEKGLQYMRKAADTFGLLVITEVMDINHIQTVYKYADVLQVGARNMQHFSLLKELGKIDKPVLLKRGLSATIEEWLMSAEYILSGTNKQVILCERGIRTFESATRFTMDISAIPMVNFRSHLPVIADPSHGIGIRNAVIPMARAALAAGADGILVEVHHDPEYALSDGAQSLFPDQFGELMQQVKVIVQAIGRSVA